MANELQEVMARLKKLEEENQILKVQAASAPSKPKKTTVKINSKGGIFFSDPCMVSFSEAKGKDYQCGINIHGYQLTAFKAFLENEALLGKVKSLLANTVAS